MLQRDSYVLNTASLAAIYGTQCDWNINPKELTPFRPHSGGAVEVEDEALVGEFDG